MQCARHFRRESLHARGLKNPEDVIQQCLTLFRKNDLEGLSQHLPPSASDAIATKTVPSLVVGGSPVREQGPLACLEPILDIGARRVLPGHLLRRSRVLGSIRLSPDTFQQRISLTARTGEESIFNWELERITIDTTETRYDQDSSGYEEERPGSKWFIRQIERDDDGDFPLPTTLQPKSSPEAVVKAQLQALRTGDVFEASSFNNWRSNDPRNAARRGGRRGFTMGLHFELLRDTLSELPYAYLLKHDSAVLGPAALPTQRSMLQEVWVKAGKHLNSSSESGNAGARDADAGTKTGWKRFVWKLELQPMLGCWVCTGIVPVLEEEEGEGEKKEP